MSVMSPNKYGVMKAAKDLLSVNAGLTRYVIELTTDDPIAAAGSNVGRNQMIFIHDGGITRGDESTLSVVWEFTMHVAVVELCGDVNKYAAVKRCMDARAIVQIALDRCTSLYASGNEWIEEARLTEIPEAQRIWKELFEEMKLTPFVMEMATIKYSIFCQEG